MKTEKVALIAVADTVYHFDKLFSYSLPEKSNAAVGCRVLVPFGTGNRSRQGVIMEISEGETAKLKEIISVLDETPLLSEEMLKLAEYIKETTFCTYFEALKIMLPAGINMKIVPSYSYKQNADEEKIEQLDEDSKRIIECLKNSRANVKRDRLMEVMGLSRENTLPEKLAKQGFIIRSDDAIRNVKDASIRMAKLSDNSSYVNLTSPKQQAVVELLKDCGAASVKEICYFTGVTNAVVTALVKKNVVTFFERETYRNPYKGKYVTPPVEEIMLTEEQQKAYDGLLAEYEKGGISLLYGITGSGKTQVFLKLVETVSKQGRGVIVMIPEIALTPQILAIFRARFGKSVAVFHSAMSLGQRADEWKRVKKGDATIAIGTRSAVFAPFSDIGLIIMDEEQEHTYKSEASPRFHARDVSRFRTAYHKSLLLLASATPSIETYALAKSGKYALFSLENRYGTAKLPTVIKADMREEIASGNTSALSKVLCEKLKENLENNKQSILLLNRRGHNTYVSCRACGYVFSCVNCSISLTYHSANGRLMCHYCGHSEPLGTDCPECGQPYVRATGLGTQRAEQELSALLPSARILRMDADTTMSRFAHEDYLSAFSKGEYDILLGTQMVAKGLDFPNVTLVGVINADGSLFADDYRGYERTFSLLTQVVGRSGRGDTEGIAVVQTAAPENPVIELASRQDYPAFYEQEIMTRKLMKYPPFCDICMVGFSSVNEEDSKKGAIWVLEQIKVMTKGKYDGEKLIVLGPSPATVPRVAGKYRMKIIIKCRNTRRFRGMMAEIMQAFGEEKEHKNTVGFVEMNPYSII